MGGVGGYISNTCVQLTIDWMMAGGGGCQKVSFDDQDPPWSSKKQEIQNTNPGINLTVSYLGVWQNKL